MKGKIMIIETERLLLRPFELTDAGDVFEYLHVPAMNCFACMKLETLDDARNEMRNRVNETEFYFAIVLKETGKVIGEIDGIRVVWSCPAACASLYWMRYATEEMWMTD